MLANSLAHCTHSENVHEWLWIFWIIIQQIHKINKCKLNRIRMRMKMKMQNAIRNWTDPNTNSENTSNQTVQNEKKLKWMQLPTNDNGIALNCFCHPLCLGCWCGCMKNSGGCWRIQMMKRSVFYFFFFYFFCFGEGFECFCASEQCACIEFIEFVNA